ncbi:MAG: hypothetical protein LW650_00740 [Planctomycetaceae bacterium]|nr:hypothetical protein [Phycisphaerales bacterium]MCE2652065.1 hypothetical protein [Planctomycetaceae bacterium]
MATGAQRVGMIAAGALLALAGMALAQPAGGGEAAKPAKRTTVLTVERLGLNDVLVDPRDAGIKRALGMLLPRLKNLPAEIPDFRDVPPGLFDLLATALERPARFALSYDPNDVEGSPFGVGVQISLGADNEAGAKAVAANVQSLLDSIPDFRRELQPAESKALPGVMEVESPGGLIQYGPRNANGRWSYDLTFGAYTVKPPVFPPLAPVAVGPEGKVMAKPFIAANFDPASLTPLLGLLAMGLAGNPATAGVLPSLQEQGVIGPEAITYSLSLAHTDDSTVFTMLESGKGRFVRPEQRQVLPESAYRLIPADAQFGTITTADLSGFVQSIKSLIAAEPDAKRAFAEITKQVGVDPVADILGNLGGVSGYYASDATGGGGLGSVVAFVGITDRAKLASANEKLATWATAMLSGEDTARGYAAIRSWTDGSINGMDQQVFWSLRFPGVPVPIEPTWTMTDTHLIIGLTPQAAMAAVAQAVGKGDAGIFSNTAVTGALPSGPRQYETFAFNDTRTTFKAGYPLVSLAGSGLANLVRSRAGDSGTVREPGIIVPPYNVLARNLKPEVSMTFWRGDDRVSQSISDKSLVVNVGSTLGRLQTFAPAVALLGGVVPAFVQAREAAERVQREQQLRQMQDQEGGHGDDMNAPPAGN